MDRIILVCNPYDQLYNNFKNKAPILSFTIERETFNIFNESDIIIIRNNDSGISNKGYWNENALIELDKWLIKQDIINIDGKIMIGIHWGGIEYQSAHSRTIIFVDSQNKIKNGDCYLTFYSETNDSLNGLSNINKYAEIVIDRINNYSLSKRRIIDLFIPLAIDIKGLSDVEKEEGLSDVEKEDKLRDYYNDIKEELKKEDKETDYFKSIGKYMDNIPIWNEIKNKLKDGYKEYDLLELVKVISENDYNEFQNNKLVYLQQIISLNENTVDNPNFLPSWLQEVVNTIDEKIKKADRQKRE